MTNCPKCKSDNIVKNGNIHNGKQGFLCKKCGRRFVENPSKKIISQETEDVIDRLLRERIPLAGIARAVGVSERWLHNYVNEKYKNIPKKADVKKKSKGRLTPECDELRSFVDNKGNKVLIWLEKDRDTGEIVGVHIGSRDKAGAKGLRDSLPPVYRQCAVCHTDFREAYNSVFPSERHRAVGKETGQTSHIERFNNTLRQRVSRLVRKTLSFSKKIENHIGAIWYFIHHYNASLG
ncbi:IS1 family transposase [Desulfonema magnum]|uniref:IS1 family transposase n=1 Tax=Desulfonema magnum TaxID=45655 RepID=UPI001A9B288A|nr:IS1 family transposase [Desulfonema magnum]